MKLPRHLHWQWFLLVAIFLIYTAGVLYLDSRYHAATTTGESLSGNVEQVFPEYAEKGYMTEEDFNIQKKGAGDSYAGKPNLALATRTLEIRAVAVLVFGFVLYMVFISSKKSAALVGVAIAVSLILLGISAFRVMDVVVVIIAALSRSLSCFWSERRER